MNEATQNLLKDAEELIYKLERYNQIEAIAESEFPAKATEFDYDEGTQQFEALDNEACSLHENSVGCYEFNLFECRTIERVLEKVDPEVYAALEAIEDFIVVGSILI